MGTTSRGTRLANVSRAALRFDLAWPLDARCIGYSRKRSEGRFGAADEDLLVAVLTPSRLHGDGGLEGRDIVQKRGGKGFCCFLWE
jgi:hypothetical protein